ncbi:MAG: 2-succinyl-5-enolpyruvyl-6-hydroxy-3-cyclohexene-1-carboxylic-acid synthase [Candidatus Latescibacterota bacterium]
MRHLYELIEIAARWGVAHAFISPGSRNAPLIIGFAHHTSITCHPVVDERSAGYMAMGVAQQTGKPVALVCTSGTAALNFAPAVAEAYYQHIPLIVLTADRPPEWIDQQDGQAIHQNRIFGDHVRYADQLPVDCSHPDARWHSNRIVNEALCVALGEPGGPVHINIPLREPLYPENGRVPTFPKEVRILEQTRGLPVFSDAQKAQIAGELAGFKKILVLVGQMPRRDKLSAKIDRLAQNCGIAFLGDITSNCHGAKHLVPINDLTANALTSEDAPELLITMGGGILPKSLKRFLRENGPQAHWHVSPTEWPDTYKSMTRHLQTGPVDFLCGLESEDSRQPSPYGPSLCAKLWAHHRRISGTLKGEQPFNEFTATSQVLAALPKPSVLHLGNSMPVRIAALCGLEDPVTQVFANRGTSGIDGVLSTAVGHAMAAPASMHVVLIGDLSFFYDRNALWQPPPENLRIVLLNDGGGGIFSIIPGPSDFPGAHALFSTPHKRDASLTAKEHGLDYAAVRTFPELQKALPAFFAKGERSRILEVFTEGRHNLSAYAKLNSIKERGES